MNPKVLVPVILLLLAASAAAVWFTVNGGENGASVTKPDGGASTVVEQGTDRWNKYQSEKGVSFDYPSTWSISENERIVFSAPGSQNTGSESIVDISLEQVNNFFPSGIDSLEEKYYLLKKNTNFQSVSIEDDTYIGYKEINSFTGVEELKILKIISGDTYILTVHSNKISNNVIDRILSSLRET